MSPQLSAPVASFIADLADHGIQARLQGSAVVYSVYAVTGALAGKEVPTAVSVVELAGWPAAPPHWVHFESTVRFATSNTDTTECLDGWLRHSRDIGAWSTDRPPITNWLAHVRGVIKDAIT
ncbi:hypothetical protein AB0F72_10935 [Actinoplanes sp. NPDC023936]|uniref:hypothetical protein n=1 Tax=Actinoplanes sp. NPDC023936 TaxID=3154910 RepID=UPI0033F204C5